MCNGFGLIVTKDNQYFIEPDKAGDVSHSEILRRLGWNDNDNQHIRRFVRVEYPDWTAGSFRFDEVETLPGWVDEDEVRNRCDKVLDRVSPLYAEYKRVIDAAYAEYKRVRDAAYAEYVQVIAAYAALVESIKGFTGYVPQ